MVEIEPLYIKTSEIKSHTDELLCGRKVFLTGNIYTARDAAHKRFFVFIKKVEKLPIEIDGAVIYYAGPTPAPDGFAVGACGPTTSCRMDPYTPTLFDMGLSGVIGKGERNDDVINAIVRNKAVYFCALGGAGALCADSIKSSDVIAFDDLGCESVKCMRVENFPLIVAIDSKGNNIFKRDK